MKLRARVAVLLAVVTALPVASAEDAGRDPRGGADVARDPEIRQVAERISAIGPEAWYGLRDDGGRTMDCLQVVPRDGERFFGLYHHRRQGRFALHLAESVDLRTWRHIRELDTHASQGELRELPGGTFLLAYEKDAPNSCWIRMQYYPDEAALRAGKWTSGRDLKRSLAPTAEGTPSVEAAEVANGSLESADIRLRFHYFENARADRLASGRLTPGGSWTAAADRNQNNSFIVNGFRGNIGDRTAFVLRGRRWYLQEAQRTSGDWASWRIVLCGEDGRFGCLLPLRTREGSVSFCNPNVTEIRFGGRRRLAVSLFLPSEGNTRGQAGQLLYLVDVDGF